VEKERVDGGTGLDVVAEVRGRVSDELVQSAERIVPWFYDNMPPYYFQTHSRDEQVRHLQGLISGNITVDKHVLALKSPCGTKVTFISPGGGTAELIAALGEVLDEEILNARMYASRDGQIRLDTFILAPQSTVDRDGPGFAEAIKKVQDSSMLPAEEVSEFADFLAGATGDCVDKFEVERAVRHFRIWKDMTGCEQVRVYREDNVYEDQCRLMVAMSSPPQKGVVQELVRVLQRSHCEVQRGYVDVYALPDQTFGLCSFYLRQCASEPLANKDRWEQVETELSRIKWFAGDETLETFADERGWSISQVMFMQAATEFVHQFLVRRDMYAYTAHNIVHAVLAHPEIAEKLLRCFELRFDPQLDAGEKQSLELQKEIRRSLRTISDEMTLHVFDVILMFIRHTLRTNYFLPNRFGLSFRMDSKILSSLPGDYGKSEDNPLPYGFFFFHGANYQAFHVRYRDTARGGVRVVPTRSQENFELESNRLFSEVTALAYSQQQKNKDIPEGGSKAVILLGPRGDIDLAVKSMADSLLDLIVTEPDAPEGVFTLPGVKDYVQQEEVIFLGPDEHIQPKHINWIVERARERGFRWPSAFMSSKPKTGINHKEYGVTSLGVIVFVEEVLNVLGIDPHKERFTVKFTGGPRGDVAGNAMRILIEQFGDNAVIVAANDGHGAAYDPEGLDHAELMRLFKDVRGISEFDPAKLRGKDAVVAGTDTPEGVELRDNLHFRAHADVFIPSGGRPDTINERNWQQYLDKDGVPTSRAIVEGANIFLSPPAREKLQQHGVMILHGASANKTGVICSSYEILAGLTLTDEEFLSIKDEYVAQVLGILRVRARSEAQLLLTEFKRTNGKVFLTELTREVSREINELGDRLAEELQGGPRIGTREDVRNLVLGYCPQVLSTKFEDRIFDNIPQSYLRALVASHAAARIIYAEGLGWLTSMSQTRKAGEVILAYLREDRRLRGYMDELEKCDMPYKEEVLRIVAETGRRFLTEQQLEVE